MTLLPEPREIRRLPRNGTRTPPSVNHDFPSWQPAAATRDEQTLAVTSVNAPSTFSADERFILDYFMNLGTEHRELVKKYEARILLILMTPRARRRLRKKLKLIAHYRKKLERIPAWKRRRQQHQEQPRARGRQISFVIFDEAQNLH